MIEVGDYVVFGPRVHWKRFTDWCCINLLGRQPKKGWCRVVRLTHNTWEDGPADWVE